MRCMQPTTLHIVTKSKSKAINFSHSEFSLESTKICTISHQHHAHAATFCNVSIVSGKSGRNSLSAHSPTIQQTAKAWKFAQHSPAPFTFRSFHIVQWLNCVRKDLAKAHCQLTVQWLNVISLVALHFWRWNLFWCSFQFSHFIVIHFASIIEVKNSTLKCDAFGQCDILLC